MIVNVRFMPPLMKEPKTVWNTGCGHQKFFYDGWEIEMLRRIGNALNISLDSADDVSFLNVVNDEVGKRKENLKPTICVCRNVWWGIS